MKATGVVRRIIAVLFINSVITSILFVLYIFYECWCRLADSIFPELYCCDYSDCETYGCNYKIHMITKVWSVNSFVTSGCITVKILVTALISIIKIITV